MSVSILFSGSYEANDAAEIAIPWITDPQAWLPFIGTLIKGVDVNKPSCENYK